MTHLAQNYQLLQPDILPGKAVTTATFGQYFEGMVTTVFAVAATLAVLMLVIAGVRYILSDVVTSKQAAKEKIFSALVGLALLIVIALILQTINPNLLGLDAFLSNLGNK